MQDYSFSFESGVKYEPGMCLVAHFVRIAH